MYATSDRQTDGRTDGRTTDANDRIMPPPPLRGRGHNKPNRQLCYKAVKFSARQISVMLCGRRHGKQ